MRFASTAYLHSQPRQTRHPARSAGERYRYPDRPNPFIDFGEKLMPHIEIGERRVHYRLPSDARADNPRGQLVLLVHGACDNSKYWRHVYRHLHDRHTPLAVDLPAHGDSEGPVLRGAGEHLAFLAELVDALDLAPFVFCGHSMGGSMAVAFAAYRPRALSGLVPVGSSPDWVVEQGEIDTWDRDPEAAYRDNLDFLFAKETSQETRDAYDLQLRAAPAAVCKADLETCRTFDLEDRLGELELPTAIVSGDQETWIEGSRRLHQGIAGSHLDVVPAAGHAIALERPESLNAVLDRFLASLA